MMKKIKKTTAGVLISLAGGYCWSGAWRKPLLASADPTPAELANQSPAYLSAPNVENLISYARYQHALFCIKYANRNPSPRSYQRVFAELAKLTEQYQADYRPPEAAKIKDGRFEDLKIESSSAPPANPQQLLTDALARHVSQLLGDELMLQLAFAAPGVDSRFFRAEPPSTVDKLNRCCQRYASVGQRFYFNSSQSAAGPSSDMDYAVLFEFHDSVYKRLVDVESKKATAAGRALLKKNGNLKILLSKFASELNSLTLSESDYYARSGLNVWSSDQTHVDPDELTAEDESGADLKVKMKREFVERNENLVLTILDLVARSDIGQFVELGGLELLLVLYEKHKTNEDFLNVIGNCLCLVSLEGGDRYGKLFIQSGWLRRLNEMVNYRRKSAKAPVCADKLDAYIYSMMELIGHKVLSNLTQPAERKVLYSTMLYPLFPLYADSIKQNEDDQQHQHVVDVIFIHGLRGSLFRTWRQDDNSDMSKMDKVVSTPGNVEVISKPADQQIISKLNTFIETKFMKPGEPYSFCWPRDWLAKDLTSSDPDAVQGFRLLGISYDSLYSLWGQELVDDKKLKLSIKQRATDLIEQLRLAHVGSRPIVWVCHSMGGLIVKQLLVELESQSSKTRFLKASGVSETLPGGSSSSSSIVDNTKAIVFFSTPHLGSQVAKTFSIFNFALYLSTEVAELSTNNAYLVDLNQKFLKLVKPTGGGKDRYNILSICENLPTLITLNIYSKTVEEQSANIGVGQFYLVDYKDHLNICKPDDRDCFIYQSVLDLVKDTARTENAHCGQCERDELARPMQAGHNFEFFHFTTYI